MRAQRHDDGEGGFLDGCQAASRKGVETKRAQRHDDGEGGFHDGRVEATKKAVETKQANVADRVVQEHGQERASELPTPPSSEADLKKDIDRFCALPDLLTYLHNHDAYASASVISTFFSPMMHTMRPGGWGDAILAFCGGEYKRACITPRAVWRAGHALAEMWGNGELKRLIALRVEEFNAAQIAQPSSFSSMRTKMFLGVEYEYQQTLSSGGYRTGSRYRVSSTHGQTGVWCDTMEKADSSYFSDIHPRPYSTVKEVLVKRLTRHRAAHGGRKVAKSWAPSQLVAAIIREEGSVGGVAGGAGGTGTKRKGREGKKPGGKGPKKTKKASG
jgi:hypothetical protein